VVVLLGVLAFLVALGVLEVQLDRTAFLDNDDLLDVLILTVLSFLADTWAFREVLPNLLDFLHAVRVVQAVRAVLANSAVSVEQHLLNIFASSLHRSIDHVVHVGVGGFGWDSRVQEGVLVGELRVQGNAVEGAFSDAKVQHFSEQF